MGAPPQPCLLGLLSAARGSVKEPVVLDSVRVRACMHVCMCVCASVYVCMCVHACTRAHVCMCVCMYGYLCVCMCFHIHVCVCMCVCMHVCVCMCVCGTLSIADQFLCHCGALLSLVCYVPCL